MPCARKRPSGPRGPTKAESGWSNGNGGKCAAGKNDDFKVVEDTGACVASARLRAIGCVHNLVLHTEEVRQVAMTWLRLHFDDRPVFEPHADDAGRPKN